MIDPVRPDGVGRAVKEDRVLLRRVLRRINRREQFHSVPHLDLHFLLAVVQAEIALPLCGSGILGKEENWEREQEDRKGEQADGADHGALSQWRIGTIAVA